VYLTLAVSSSFPTYPRETAALLWACADPKLNQHRVIGASLRPPSRWRTPTFQLAEGVDTDVQSVNIGIHSAWRKAARSGDVSSTRQHSIMGHATEEKRECHCSFLVLISNATFHSAHCNQRLRSSSTSSICLFGRKKILFTRVLCLHGC